jgi:hypothetical protein
MASVESTARRRPPALALAVPLVVGALVALTLGIYGRVHTPTGVAVNVAGFSSPLTVKVWLSTVAVFCALIQLGSALVMYGKIPGVAGPRWIGGLHRWSGRLAFLFAIPVALHCLYAFGLESYTPRVLIHSLLGCFFFGVFTAKMLALPRRGLPGWTLPVLGGLAFTTLVGIWVSSALWFFTTSGIKF